MAPPQIEAQMTVLDVTERYPATIEVLARRGFPRLRQRDQRQKLGKALTIRAAAKLRRIEEAELIGELRRAATEAGAGADVTLEQAGQQVVLRPGGDVQLSGLLPCPVRLPLIEAVDRLAGELQRERGLSLGYSLAAASVGADALTAELTRAASAEDLPEVFVSAGFESFFDHRAVRRFKSAGAFVDLAPAGENPDFAGLGLRDPEGHYSILGVVPAVFLQNGAVLGDEPPPRSWEELLSERFRGRVALPVSDFDLMNGMLLTLYQRFGDEGVRRLARAMVTALHPSQAVGRFAGRQNQQAAISIVPYFFSRMTLGSQAIRVIWPEDGAIVCPIIMLTRADALERSRPVAELLLSREVGEILAHRGLFPVLHPEVDNRLPEGASFRWLGWPFMAEHDLGELIPRLNRLFTETAPGAAA